MTPRSTQTQRNNDFDDRNDGLEARVSLLEYQFGEVLKKLDRIESKQDSAIRQIDQLKYVSTHEFDQYIKDAAKTFVTVESIRSMRTLFWAIITASVLGLISLGFFIIQSLIKK